VISTAMTSQLESTRTAKPNILNSVTLRPNIAHLRHLKAFESRRHKLLMNPVSPSGKGLRFAFFRAINQREAASGPPLLFYARCEHETI
jgi:hypothetical protein